MREDSVRAHAEDTDAWTEAVTAELVRLTLGGRGPSRPELVMPARRGLAAAALGPRLLRRRG